MNTYADPLARAVCRPADHARAGGCFECCDACNYDRHQCPGCGDPLRHDGIEVSTGEPHGRCY